MNRPLSPLALFLLALALLAATNAIVLVHVAANRRGEPESRLVLSERELALPYRSHAENSSLSLQLRWQLLGSDDNETYSNRWSPPTWLNEAKMRDLGFPVDSFMALPDRQERKMLSPTREVFVVLELDGKAYREAVRRVETKLTGPTASAPEPPVTGNDPAKAARERLERLRTSDSRLFAIDAGLDPVALRKQYEDRSRFLLVKGLVEPVVIGKKTKHEISGRIERLLNERIHVPLEHRSILDAFTVTGAGGKSKNVSRYQVELAMGSRLEPWIMTVSRLAAD